MGELDKVGELDIAGPREILGILAHGVCKADGAEMAPANIRTARWETREKLRSPEGVLPGPCPSGTCPKTHQSITVLYQPGALKAAASMPGLEVSESVRAPFKNRVLSFYGPLPFLE